MVGSVAAGVPTTPGLLSWDCRTCDARNTLFRRRSRSRSEVAHRIGRDGARKAPRSDAKGASTNDEGSWEHAHRSCGQSESC